MYQPPFVLRWLFIKMPFLCLFLCLFRPNSKMQVLLDLHSEDTSPYLFIMRHSCFATWSHIGPLCSRRSFEQCCQFCRYYRLCFLVWKYDWLFFYGREQLGQYDFMLRSKSSRNCCERDCYRDSVMVVEMSP
jgi:hypothetical protein